MGTFNLSMVAARTPPSDVQASAKPDTVENPKTGALTMLNDYLKG